MKTIATISGTPSATVKNTAACPGWAARSDLPNNKAATKPSRPAISARSAPTGNPSSRRDAHARPATSAMLVASTATAKTIPLTDDDCAASIVFLPAEAASSRSWHPARPQAIPVRRRSKDEPNDGEPVSSCPAASRRRLAALR